jgi:hypothetical protein
MFFKRKNESFKRKDSFFVALWQDRCIKQIVGKGYDEWWKKNIKDGVRTHP